MRPSASPAKSVTPSSRASCKSGGSLGQHREAARDMEAADDHRQPAGAELAGEVERTRKLIRLHPDKTDETAAGGADAAHRASSRR